MRARGFTTVEVLVAFAIMVVAFGALWSVFSGGVSQAVQSREHTVALLQAQSFLEEVRAHPYGQPEPKSWRQDVVRPVRVRVEGRGQILEYRQEVTFLNRSFIGQSDEDFDEVTLKLSWHDGELKVKTAVWR